MIQTICDNQPDSFSNFVDRNNRPVYSNNQPIYSNNNNNFRNMKQGNQHLYSDIPLETSSSFGLRNNHNGSQPFIPCFSMIATGTCCHGSKCKFIHDPRLVLRPAAIRKKIEKIMMKWTIYHNEVLKVNNTKKNGKNTDASDSDIFFWPAMRHSHHLNDEKDSSNPYWSANTYCYHPGEGKQGNYERQLSIWLSFIENCGTYDSDDGNSSSNSSVVSGGSSNSSGRSRLGVFQKLVPDSEVWVGDRSDYHLNSDDELSSK